MLRHDIPLFDVSGEPMWSLNNRTSYSVGKNWIRDKIGAHHWLVAVKATFQVTSEGRLSLADTQAPPLLTPLHRGEPGMSSLRADSDLLAIKPATDVLVEASAHAPGGAPATRVPVALRVAELHKALVVHGPRVYEKGFTGLSPSKPRPFTESPIVYEWAYGGQDLRDPAVRGQRFDSRNPVGRGVASKPERLKDQPVHTVEYPDGDFTRRGPAGFGPIDMSWSPRRELAGTFDEAWEREQRPLLPVDHDERFALGAPHDQGLGRFLRGGERLELMNLTPRGVLRLELPKLYFVMTTRFGSRAREHRARLATVRVDAHQMLLEMVWQSALRVFPREVDLLDETRIREKPFLT
ncbi:MULTISPECIES: DUF2169 family type VI secretion system accessory protein [Myxococcus]|uniref:DUF2169 family type VI secretion system accessory protein n=1 Tax=Myxococcus TaxID=32 RepID=UPI001F07BDED|nr:MULTISPECIES: DUF2169 domain-containing protein [Myxococcus]